MSETLRLVAASTSWRSNKGAALIVAVAIFTLVQIFVSVHAAKYGDGPHDHFGQACVLSLAAPGGDKFVASAAFVFAAAALTMWRVRFAAPQTAPALVRIRASHPRGPPNR